MAFEKLHFKSQDGVEIVTPYFVDSVTRKEFRKIQGAAKEVGGMENLDDDLLFKAAKFDDELMEQLDELTLRDYAEFVSQWANQAPDMGKS